MVQADISQLTRECNDWRAVLRSLRDTLTLSKKELQDAAGTSLSRDQLTEVEHYHNQFHIQLINIHDLKQAIKSHDRRIQFEQQTLGKVSDEALADHENLFEQFQSEEGIVQELRNDFAHFIESTHSTA